MVRLRDTAAHWLRSGQPAIVVEVLQARGSVPRGSGTRMLVSRAQLAGTVGGGHLELKAIEQARTLLAGKGRAPLSVHFPLGPALGQCCGGAVTLGFALLDAAALAAWPQAAPRFHLQLYGAGHVGRAIVQALAPLHCVVDWIDEREEEFPATFDACTAIVRPGGTIANVGVHGKPVELAMNELWIKNINISNILRNDSLALNIKLSNDDDNTQLDLNGLLEFEPDSTKISLLPSNLKINDQDWNIQEKVLIGFNNGKTRIQNLSINHEEQEVYKSIPTF